MKAQKRGTKEQPRRNDAEKMKYQGIDTKDKKTLKHVSERQNNCTWMRWINAKKMVAICATYSKVSKTLEHLGFMEFEEGTQECKRGYDFSS